MSVTDGTISTEESASETVRIIGTVTTTPGAGTQPVSGTVTANQGTPNTNTNGWFVRITDGTRNALVGTDGSLFITAGTVTAVVTLNALTAVGPGVIADFGSAKSDITFVFTATAGVSAGAVALEVSHDNSNWFRTGTPVTLTASTTGSISVTGAYRYARGAITTAVTGGTVSGTLAAA